MNADGTWTARSRLAASEPIPLSRPNASAVPVQAPQPVGVTLYLEPPRPERLLVKTAQGDFEIRLADLHLDRPQPVLGGRARVELLPSAAVVADTPAHEDYPAIAADRDRGLWVVWTAYQDRADRILCRRFDGSAWSAPETVSPNPGDYYRPAAAVDGDGRLWVVWSAQENHHWDLWTRRRDRCGWSAPERLTRSLENDLEPRLVADARGRLLLVWQGFRNGQTDILARPAGG